jgi:integrase
MTDQHEQPAKKPRKQRRRGHGEGSVFELKDRSRTKPWVAQVTLPDGKKKQTYHLTQQEAIAARRKMLNELEQGTLITEKDQQVGPYLERWLEDVQKPQVRLSSYATYRQLLKNHILPALGHYQLRRLTPQHIQAFYSAKLKAGLSPSTVQLMHALLHKAFDNAVRWRYLSRNVCDDVTQPHPCNQGQAQRLVEIVRGHPLEALLLLALITGMRRGELMSLRWKDIDLENKCIHVRHAVAPISGYGYVENESKIARSRRKITLPPFALEVLEQHRTGQLAARARASATWEDHDLVFCNRRGKFLRPKTLRDQFTKLLNAAGLPYMRFHDLRHSAATILLSMGVHPKVVQELLGHSNIAITLGIYGHVLPGMHEEAMGKWDALF